MKILLIDPPQFQINPYISFANIPSLGLLALNSYLNEKGHEILFLDCKCSQVYFNEIRETVGLFKPDIVGVTAYTIDIYSAMAVCSVIKEAYPKAYTVLGGYHASALPELTLESCKDVDCCVIGEGELTFQELTDLIGAHKSLSASDLAKIPGLAYRSNGKPVRSSPRQFLTDLDMLPPSHYSNLDMQKYHFPIKVENCDYATGFAFSFSRGCWFDCKYCSNSMLWKQTWRSFSPKRMISEIRQVHEQYGKLNFFFGDNDFLLDQERLSLFLDELEKSGLSIKWSFETSTANILKHQDILPRMKRLGLYMCITGFEFASPSRLNWMDKRNGSIEQSILAAKILKENGILIFALGIIGFPDEGESSIREYARFFQGLRADIVYTQCLTPLPGTRLFHELLGKDKIGSFDFSKYDLLHPVLAYDNESTEQIQKWHKDLSDLLYQPFATDLYAEYRQGTITLENYNRRFFLMANSLENFYKNKIEFAQLLRIYNKLQNGEEAPPIATDIKSTELGLAEAEKLSLYNAAIQRIGELDEIHENIFGTIFKPLNELQKKEIFSCLATHDQAKKIMKVLGIKSKDLMLKYKNIDRRLFEEAHQEWEDRKAMYLEIQNNVPGFSKNSSDLLWEK